MDNITCYWNSWEVLYIILFKTYLQLHETAWIIFMLHKGISSSAHLKLPRQVLEKKICRKHWWANILLNCCAFIMSWRPLHIFPFWLKACELAADGLCVSLQLTHSNWLLRLCSPLQPVNHAILRRSCLSPHPDERHLAGWQQEDWILCAQKCCTKKEIACVQQSRCWERGDWVVLVIGTSPPVLSPFVSRLVVACNHGDSWSCYLLRGRGGELVTLKLGLLVSVDGVRTEQGGVGLCTKTTLFSSHPFTAWTATEGNGINSMK